MINVVGQYRLFLSVLVCFLEMAPKKIPCLQTSNWWLSYLPCFVEAAPQNKTIRLDVPTKLVASYFSASFWSSDSFHVSLYVGYGPIISLLYDSDDDSDDIYIYICIYTWYYGLVRNCALAHPHSRQWTQGRRILDQNTFLRVSQERLFWLSLPARPLVPCSPCTIYRIT